VSVSKHKSQRGRKIPNSANTQLHYKLSNLKKRDYFVGDSDDIVHMDWSSELSELKNLEPLYDDRDPDSYQR
jgi:hypothetical protein